MGDTAQYPPKYAPAKDPETKSLWTDNKFI